MTRTDYLVVATDDDPNSAQGSCSERQDKLNLHNQRESNCVFGSLVDELYQRKHNSKQGRWSQGGKEPKVIERARCPYWPVTTDM